MKKKLPIFLLITVGILVLKTNLTFAQSGQWKLAGNTLAGTEKLGSINNFPIRFYTNNAQRMTLTPAGYLGIGTTLPEANLHILRGRAALITADSNSTLVVESAQDNFISLLAINTKKSAVVFGSNTLALDAGIIYNSPGITRGLAFNTNGNLTRMVLTGTGFLGVGTKTPKTNLHIFKGSSGASAPNVSSPLVVENNGDNFINVLAPSSNKSGILFGDNLNPEDAGVIYNSSLAPNGFQFNTNGNVTRMALTSTGFLGIGTNTPKANLHIFRGSSFSPTANVNSTVVVENSVDNYINFLTPSDYESGILFGRAASTAHGGIVYNNPANLNGFQFRTNNNSTKMVLTSTGYLGIGTNAPATEMHLVHSGVTTSDGITHGLRIQNGVNGQYWKFFVDGYVDHGTLYLYKNDKVAGYFDWETGDYYGVLDVFNIQVVENAPEVLNSLMQLKVKKYQTTENKPGAKKHYGIGSEEVEKLFPEIASLTNKDGKDYHAVNKSAYGVIAIKAIQEQQVIIENQKADIDEMKAMINELKTRIDQLSSGTSTNSKASSQNNQEMELSGARLMQNAPNPFNAVTVISYYLPEIKGNASIQIVSSNGELLKTFPITQKGKGLLSINAGTLASGNYHYILIVDGKKIDSKQMIITK
ncbi:hypothetical protein BH10BAC2_BH10BAC2_35250 [soil metagenome]